MAEQLSLFESDHRKRPADRLFFAVLPDPSAAAHIARLVSDLRSKHGLRGKPIDANRLHISLYGLGDHTKCPDVIAKADAAARAVEMPPFVVSFDHAGSFSGKPGKRPLVLRGDDGVAGLMAFHQSLGKAMLKTGVRRWVNAAYTPHVTFLYDALGVAEHAVEPIRWIVYDFVLVHSYVGQTKHVPVARWSLRG